MSVRVAEARERTATGREVLGQRIRELRVASGLSQRALTHQIGLSAHSNLADYEAGRRVPPLDVLAACERALGVHDGELAQLRQLALNQAAAATRAPAVLAPVSHGSVRARLVWLMVAAVLILLAGAGVTHQLLSSPSAPRPSLVVAPRGGWDGMSACDDSTVLLGSRSVAGRTSRDVARGSGPPAVFLGTLSLRYSPGCSLAWAKFVSGPAVVDSAGTFSLEVHRPSDGAETRTDIPVTGDAESDPLLTTPGCVYAQVTLLLQGSPNTTARTGCLQP